MLAEMVVREPVSTCSILIVMLSLFPVPNVQWTGQSQCSWIYVIEEKFEYGIMTTPT